jgi:uncharacterized protein YjbI with pentapeptide repeats
MGRKERHRRDGRGRRQDASAIPLVTSSGEPQRELPPHQQTKSAEQPNEPAPNTLATEADKYAAVLGAVGEAGNAVFGFWVTFVSLGTYLVAVVASVTHQQLFLDSPIKLPLVDVNLPLYAFFCVVPALFIVLHVYILLQLLMLSAKVRRYDEVVSDKLDPDVQRRLRQQLPNTIFLQFLAAPEQEREHVIGYLLRSIAWLTIVIGPVFLLLLMQWRFLPYQDQLATWIQRLAIVLDVVVIWLLWQRVLSGQSKVGRLGWSRQLVAIPLTVSVLVLPFLVLTFPGEWVDERLATPLFHRWAVSEMNSIGERDADVANWLKSTPQARRWVTGTFKLSELDVFGEEKLAEIVKSTKEANLFPWQGKRTLRLEGPRNFRYANLAGADLRRADLRDARLDLACLVRARLDGALMDRASMSKASMRQASARSASFESAILHGADLSNADLSGAWFHRAHLQRSDLTWAFLKGTQFLLAEIQGASLNDAVAYAARFDGANLQGSSLHGANLNGAQLPNADLRGASLHAAQLQIATLHSARFAGASLDDAQLQGAEFEDPAPPAYVQMSPPDPGRFDGASFLNPYVFRTVLNLDRVRGVRIRNPVNKPLVATPRVLNSPVVPLTDVMADEWVKNAKEYVANEMNGVVVARRLTAQLERFKKAKPADDEQATSRWTGAVDKSLDDEAYREKLKSVMEDLVCSDRGAPYTAQGLLRNGRLLATGDHLRAISERMLGARAQVPVSGGRVLAACPGVNGFSDSDWVELKKLVDGLSTKSEPAVSADKPSAFRPER